MPELQPNSYRASEASHRYVLDLVRDADRERFLGALFAPEPQRSGPAVPAGLRPRAGAHTQRDEGADAGPHPPRMVARGDGRGVGRRASRGRSPSSKSLSETVRRHGLTLESLVALIDAREEEIEGPLDVMRAGHALADLELGVLGVEDAASRQAAHAVGAAWLMGEGPERDQLVGDARRSGARSIRPRCRSCCRPFRSAGRWDRCGGRWPIGGQPSAGDTEGQTREEAWRARRPMASRSNTRPSARRTTRPSC